MYEASLGPDTVLVAQPRLFGNARIVWVRIADEGRYIPIPESDSPVAVQRAAEHCVATMLIVGLGRLGAFTQPGFMDRVSALGDPRTRHWDVTLEWLAPPSRVQCAAVPAPTALEASRVALERAREAGYATEPTEITARLLNVNLAPDGMTLTELSADIKRKAKLDGGR